MDHLFAITSQEALERISRHCPQAMSAYLQCINRCDNEGVVYFSRKMVEIDLSERWGSFVNRIKNLALENLLEWHPFDEGIAVTLAALDENE